VAKTVVPGTRTSPGNWGRWGPDDERGAANFITAKRRLAAARLVVRGEVYSLAIPLKPGAMPGSPMRAQMVHHMTLDGGDFAAGVRLPGGNQVADDYIAMPSQTGTHLDGLAHVWYDDELYNGHSATRVRSYGATRCGIENVGSLVTRGVLLDVAGLYGVEHLAADHVVGPRDLERCAKAQGTEVGTADAVLVRTGWYTVFARDRDRYYAANPGVGAEGARWLAERSVAVVGADNLAFEPTVGPNGFEGGDLTSTVHRMLIRDYGTYILELLDLESLAADRVHEFMFCAAPLPIVGGVGSPLNPLAIV
jgi:kynurenine formamidase